MATGGSVSYSTTPDVVSIFGRVTTAQAKLAPANSGKWTVADGGTGIFNITFAESYSEFLGAQITCEGTTGDFATMASWTASTRVMVVNTFSATTVAADDIAFSFQANFSESKVP